MMGRCALMLASGSRRSDEWAYELKLFFRILECETANLRGFCWLMGVANRLRIRRSPAVRCDIVDDFFGLWSRKCLLGSRTTRFLSLSLCACARECIVYWWLFTGGCGKNFLKERGLFIAA